MAVNKKREKRANKKKLIKTEKKLSDVILEFVGPITENDIVVTKRIIEFGIIIWNTSFLSIEEREERKSSIMKGCFRIKEDEKEDYDVFNEIYNYLLFRKDTIFQKDNRFIVNYKINEREDDWNLTVAYQQINQRKTETD